VLVSVKVAGVVVGGMWMGYSALLMACVAAGAAIVAKHAWVVMLGG